MGICRNLGRHRERRGWRKEEKSLERPYHVDMSGQIIFSQLHHNGGDCFNEL